MDSRPLTKTNETKLETLVQKARIRKGGLNLLNIEAENSCDIFVGRNSLMNHVRVENRIRAEDKAADKCVYQIHNIIEWKEDGNNSSRPCQ